MKNTIPPNIESVSSELLDMLEAGGRSKDLRAFKKQLGIMMELIYSPLSKYVEKAYPRTKTAEKHEPAISSRSLTHTLLLELHDFLLKQYNDKGQGFQFSSDYNLCVLGFAKVLAGKQGRNARSNAFRKLVTGYRKETPISDVTEEDVNKMSMLPAEEVIFNSEVKALLEPLMDGIGQSTESAKVKFVAMALLLSEFNQATNANLQAAAKALKIKGLPIRIARHLRDKEKSLSPIDREDIASLFKNTKGNATKLLARAKRLLGLIYKRTYKDV